jgi:hypothetical protein
MIENIKLLLSKLNSIYIVILGCLLGLILIINSDYVNSQKASIKLNQEKANLFNKIISKRSLEEIPIGSEDEYFMKLTRFVHMLLRNCKNIIRQVFYPIST